MIQTMPVPMKGASFSSVASVVLQRNLWVVLRSPGLLLPALLFPICILIGFVGALSTITSIPGFTFEDYTAFLYVFVLFQGVALTGASGGLAMAEDFESRFMRRVMVAAPNRAGIVVGYVIAMLARAVLVSAVLTIVSLGLGMQVDGSPLDLLALFALAALFNIVVTLWATGVALHIRSMKAAPGMFLPVFLLLFLTPVYVPLDLLTGWLKAVATVNPLTRFLEAGRAYISGGSANAVLAFGLVLGMLVLTTAWAFRGLRRAEARGA